MRRMNTRLLPLLLLTPLVATLGCAKPAPPTIAQLSDVEAGAVLEHI